MHFEKTRSFAGKDAEPLGLCYETTDCGSRRITFTARVMSFQRKAGITEA